MPYRPLQMGTLKGETPYTYVERWTRMESRSSPASARNG